MTDTRAVELSCGGQGRGKPGAGAMKPVHWKSQLRGCTSDKWKAMKEKTGH